MTYYYTADWFSGAIPVWEQILKHLKDTPCSVLEIGSYQGRSAVWLLENILTHDDARITCVDTFEGSEEHNEDLKLNLYQIFEQNVIKNFGSKVTAMKGMSGDMLRELKTKEAFDMIYVDGAHYSANVMEDAVLSFPLLKTGGIMIFDDFGFTRNPEDPKDIYNPHNCYTGICGFINAYAPYIEIIHQGWQIAIRKLKNH